VITPDGHVWAIEAGGTHQVADPQCPNIYSVLRIDPGEFLQAVTFANAPSLSTTGLLILIGLLGAIAALKLRT
jgi:hypothetical protein